MTLSSEAQAVLDATDYPEDWATRIRVAAAIRAVVKELKCFGITEKNILAIADELESL